MQISATPLVVEAAEIATLIVSVCLGWVLWSAILWSLDRRALGRKLPGVNKTVDDLAEGFAEDRCAQEDGMDDSDSDGSSTVNEISSRDAPLALPTDLFESYGLFGAGPGIWLTDKCAAQGLTLEDAIVDCDTELESTCGDIALPEALDLFESYNLFDATLGAWRPARASLGVTSDDEASERLEVSDYSAAFSAASELFESYGLFGAGPGVWNAAMITEGVASDDEASAQFAASNCAVAFSSTSDLFESYGLFDASPGTWNPRRSDEPVNSDFDSKSVADDTRSFPQPSSPPVVTLLEHYGLFGAEQGTWCNAHMKTCYEAASCVSTAVSEDEGYLGEAEMMDDSDDDSDNASISDGAHLSYPLLFEQYDLFGAPAGTWAGCQ